MSQRYAIALLALVAGGPADADELTALADALGPGRAAVEGIATWAECSGPDGDFVTETVSLRDGAARFVQVHPDRLTELLVWNGTVYQRSAASAPVEPADPSFVDLVRGHEIHRMLLDLDARFRTTGATWVDDCLAVEQATGGGARLCRDPSGARVAAIELAIPDIIGGGWVRMELGDWRVVTGVALPYTTVFEHSGERFSYRFTQVLPFRLAPGAELPGSPATGLDRLADLAEIVAIHERGMAAHRASDVEALVQADGPRGTVSGRGTLSETTPALTRERLGPYLESTQFSRYVDLVPPVVAVSADGTLGWLACEMEAEGLQLRGGEKRHLAFGFSWVELLARGDDGGWRRIGNASSQRP